MQGHKRTFYLIPAGIVLLGATITLVVAMAGMGAAAAIRPVDAGSQGYRGARDLGSTTQVAAANPVDGGSQGYRGARDLGSTTQVAAANPVDGGSQGYRGARDLGSTTQVAAANPVDAGSQGYRGARDIGVGGTGSASAVSTPRQTLP
jgi:hypothetical protein